MMEEDRYSIDTLTPINAVDAALQMVKEMFLRDHISHCVADAFMSGDIVD